MLQHVADEVSFIGGHNGSIVMPGFMHVSRVVATGRYRGFKVKALEYRQHLLHVEVNDETAPRKFIVVQNG
jgi:hypothetical protein